MSKRHRHGHGAKKGAEDRLLPHVLFRFSGGELAGKWVPAVESAFVGQSALDFQQIPALMRALPRQEQVEILMASMVFSIARHNGWTCELDCSQAADWQTEIWQETSSAISSAMKTLLGIISPPKTKK